MISPTDIMCGAVMTPTDTYLPGSGAAAKDDSFPTQYPMVRYLTYKGPGLLFNL